MDTRPNLDDLLKQVPISLNCYCFEEPERECPDHGDTSMFAHSFQSAHLDLLRLAHIVEDIRKLADDLAVGSRREREIGLEILQRLAQDVDLTPTPINTDPWGPGNPMEVPF